MTWKMVRQHFAFMNEWMKSLFLLSSVTFIIEKMCACYNLYNVMYTCSLDHLAMAPWYKKEKDKTMKKKEKT